jgi:serine protease Do
VRNVGLVVPFVVAWRIAETLARQGYISRPYLGINGLPVQIPVALQTDDALTWGLLIAQTEENGPAFQSGILIGDILVSLDGQAFVDNNGVVTPLSDSMINPRAQAMLIRAGARKTLEIMIGQTTSV